MKFRQPYAYDSDLASAESGLECNDISLAVQADKDDTDINTIMYRFGKTGQLPQVNKTPLDPTQFYEVQDYQSALNAVRAADQAFLQIPAELREKFDNNPGKFIEYMNHPDTKPEDLKQYGILRPDYQSPVKPDPDHKPQ